MLEKYICGKGLYCKNQTFDGMCSLIPGACDLQMKQKHIQECCLCSHRKMCKYREEFEQKKADTYIKLECKYFTN